MTDGRHISQEDLALHALQALSKEESAAVRLHLAECEACRASLAELAGEVALVAMAVEPHAVPAGARDRFLSRIAASSKAQSESQQANAPHGDARPYAAPTVLPIARPARRFATSAAWGAIAALLILTAWLGLEVSRLHRQLEVTSQQAAIQASKNAHAQEVVDLLTARTSQHILLTAAKTPPAPSARAVYAASNGALILQASNLQPLPSGKTYELWVIPANGTAPVPAGLFQPDPAGTASLVLPTIPHGIAAKAFGVTMENAGGATTPTAPILLSGAAPTAGE